jgi:hypothetical protein
MRLGTLFRNEMRKMWKRLATWVTLGLFTLITLVDLGEEFFRARRDPSEPFVLPEAWGLILGEEVMIGFIFAAVLLILLVAAEFGWRTARQNVIDGLSKTQWFTAKALLVPFLAALFLAERVLVGGLLARAGTDAAAAAADPLFGAAQWAALGGMFVAALGYGSLALFASTAIRSSGPAMAVWFAWIAFGENLLRGGLGSLFEGMKPALRWLPKATFDGLRNYMRYDSAAYEKAADWAAENGQILPAPISPEPALLGSLAWIAFFIAVSYLWFRRRDL